MSVTEVTKTSLIIAMLAISYATIFTIESTRYSEKASVAAER